MVTLVTYGHIGIISSLWTLEESPVNQYLNSTMVSSNTMSFWVTLVDHMFLCSHGLMSFCFVIMVPSGHIGTIWSHLYCLVILVPSGHKHIYVHICGLFLTFLEKKKIKMKLEIATCRPATAGENASSARLHIQQILMLALMQLCRNASGWQVWSHFGKK